MTDKFEISHMGAHGDGVALAQDGEIYIPYTLPGEVVRADRDGSWARLCEVISPSPKRITPECGHFTRCGGCKLQHMHGDDYCSWKSERVVKEFARRGLDCAIEPIWSAGLGQRRRAQFTAARTKKTLQFGFHHYRSDVIENIDQCPILVAAIEEHIDDLSQLTSHFLTRKRQAKVSVTACLDGLDVSIEGARRELAPDIVARISSDCDRARVQRLVVDGEILFQRGEPEIDFSGVRVPLPPGVFLQACAKAEDHMCEIIREAFSGCKWVADLFAGVGTFSFAVAKHAAVLAVENSPQSLAALKSGFDQASGLKPVSRLNRDLMQDPLTALELGKFDGVIFDPPRAGALAQAGQIAKSKVPDVVAVSCNPNTLGRDLNVLIEGGYRIKSVHVIDQFVYSPHVEVVAHLTK